MILTMIYDRKAETHEFPKTFKNVQQAIRAFQNEMESDDSVISKYREDYEQVVLAEIDEGASEPIKLVSRHVISRGSDFPRKQKIEQFELPLEEKNDN